MNTFDDVVRILIFALVIANLVLTIADYLHT